MKQSKKPTRPASAKLAGSFAAGDNVRDSAEKVLHFGKEFLRTGADEAQKAQEKLFSISRESADKMSKSADAVNRFMSESVAASRDGVEGCIECSNVTANMTKDLSSEWFDAANQAFADSVEISKEMLACRTLSDMIELNNRLFSRSCDRFFQQSTKFSDMLFEYTTQALEPVNERVVKTSERLNKAFSA